MYQKCLSISKISDHIIEPTLGNWITFSGKTVSLLAFLDVSFWTSEPWRQHGFIQQTCIEDGRRNKGKNSGKNAAFQT